MKINEIFATDKLLHLSAGFVMTVVFTAIFTVMSAKYPINWGIVVALVFIVGKEIYDLIKKKNPIADSLFDFAFGVSGSGIALFCISAFM